MKPQAVVALILALTVFISIVGHTVLNHFWPVPEATYNNAIEAWLDFFNIIVGGLIGYIAGSNPND